MAGRATIGDVAARAGVSRATVSRAFTRPHLLTTATVERVRAAADALGYNPSSIARALATGRFGTIGLIVPDIANPFFPPLIRAAQARAEAAGYATLIGDSDERPDREDTLIARLAPQVDGFVVASPRLAEDRIRDHARDKPMVLVNRDIDGLARVLVDVAGGITASVEHLFGLGHRRIAYVGGPSASWANQQRERGAQQAASRLGAELIIVPAHRPTYEAGQSVAASVAATRVTAILAFDDIVAQGIIAGLGAAGLSAPRDMSIVGFDDVLAAMAYPPLTTVAAHCAEAGANAVDLLIGQVELGEVSTEAVTVPTRLVIRSSTAAPRAGDAVIPRQIA